MSAHGSCNGCGKGFGVFRKESNCHNCGLIFCSKCADNKAAIPKLNGEVRSVCTRCYNVIDGKIKDAHEKGAKRDVSPPANFLRLQAAQSSKSAPQSRGESLKKKKGLTADPVVKQLLKPEYRNLSKADMEIAERLEKLKEDSRELLLGPNPLSPVQDIEQRLARLKGSVTGGDHSGRAPSAVATSNLPRAKPMTQQQETNNLLNQVRDEVNIDRRVAGSGEPVTPASKAEVGASSGGPETSSVETDVSDVQSLIAQAAAELDIDAQKAIIELKQDKEIMARLHRLKSRKSMDADTDTPSNIAGAEVSEVLSEEDEEGEVKTLLQQVLEERRLDEQVEAKYGEIRSPLREEKSLHLPPSEPELDLDELPWCSVCNEDATLRCIDCDMDLYCKRCCNDYHELNADDHEYIPYKRRASRVSDED